MNPLVAPTSETTPTLLNSPPPTHLKHRCLYLLPYEGFDGQYSNHTDCKYLGVGIAQYREGEDTPVSVKSWRKPEDKWSRQSEELPTHRNIDMTILQALVMQHDWPDTVAVPAKTFIHQNEEIVLRRLEPVNSQCRQERETTLERLKVLKALLNNMPNI